MTHSPSCPEIELLPCPFCGDQAHIYGNEVDFVRRWSVRCNDCNADLDVCEDKQQEAAKAWNTRPVAQCERERAFDRYSYDAGLMAAVGVCKAHSKWAEDKIDEKLPVEGSQNQSFATISNTADDLAEMIGDLAVSSMSSTEGK